ncbi:hypothetical protein [Macrococcus bovicus]|uniref:Uncharacterized protein n=1 Tax=Macrococcus bovicus TaxID=69968 RepID=A0A4R6C3L2_9STAP|nr:hypothetical protein [Macrococcus bovicus]TDM15606.1 hypothetical protein ERX55_01490 [Macrococcus bovicus]
MELVTVFDIIRNEPLQIDDKTLLNLFRSENIILEEHEVNQNEDCVRRQRKRVGIVADELKNRGLYKDAQKKLDEELKKMEEEGYFKQIESDFLEEMKQTREVLQNREANQDFNYLLGLM